MEWTCIRLWKHVTTVWATERVRMDSRLQKAKISSFASKCEPIQNDSADRCVGEKLVLRALCGWAKLRKFSSSLFRMVAEAPEELTFRRVIVAITSSLRVPGKHKLVELLPQQRVWFCWSLLSCWLSWVVILPQLLVESDRWIEVCYSCLLRWRSVTELEIQSPQSRRQTLPGFIMFFHWSSPIAIISCSFSWSWLLYIQQEAVKNIEQAICGWWPGSSWMRASCNPTKALLTEWERKNNFVP